MYRDVAHRILRKGVSIRLLSRESGPRDARAPIIVRTHAAIDDRPYLSSAIGAALRWGSAPARHLTQPTRSDISKWQKE
jgi:hypothetical protein